MTDFNWMLWIVTPIIIVYYLYRHVWPAVRKFIRLFQGIRINPRSHLTEAEYKKLSVGSLYALQQGAYLNSLTLDIKDKLPTILADWWGICNAQDAKQTLEYLGKKGFAYYFSHVYQAFLLDDEEAKDRIFQQHMDSQEDYDKAVEQLHNLEDCYDELLECGTITCQMCIRDSGHRLNGKRSLYLCFIQSEMMTDIIDNLLRNRNYGLYLKRISYDNSPFGTPDSSCRRLWNCLPCLVYK